MKGVLRGLFWIAAAVLATGCDGAAEHPVDAAAREPTDGAVGADAATVADAASPDRCDAGVQEAACIETGDINPDCLEKAPFEGECAQRDVCCRRSSNSAREQHLCPDNPLVLEYRLNESVAPEGRPISLSGWVPSEFDSETQSILWRFVLPRRDGRVVTGRGEMLFGFGRYNCDGTYSFYDTSAAPPRADCPDCDQNPARWAPLQAVLHIDASAIGAERLRVQLPRDPERSDLHAPSVQFMPEGTELTFEVVHQGLEWEPFDLEGEGRDCIGSRERGNWVTGARYTTFIPMEPNAHATIAVIDQSYCQVLAFGILPEGMKDKSCSAERCLPDGGLVGDGGCDFERLPDSLCPISEEERLAWDCHLGAEGNPNQERDYPAALPCTPDAPTATLDPAVTAETGQCCDPLGASDALPACNAFRQVREYVAAAATITREPSSELQPDCGIRFRAGD